MRRPCTIMMLAIALVVGFAGLSAAQLAPQVPLAGQAGELLRPRLDRQGLRTANGVPVTQQVVLVGDVVGVSLPLGAVLKDETINFSVDTLPQNCKLKVWLAIKAANNGNGLQQLTKKTTGPGTLTRKSTSDGQAVVTIQTQSSSDICIVLTGWDIR